MLGGESSIEPRGRTRAVTRAIPEQYVTGSEAGGEIRLELRRVGFGMGGGALRLLRGLALGALLLGPLATAEIVASGSLEQLYPYMQDWKHWPDAKWLIMKEAGCPKLLAMGSSITDRTLGRQTVPEEPFPGVSKDSIFNFGVIGFRGFMLWQLWDRIERSGCVPEYVFVEFSPVLTTSKPGAPGRGELFDLPVLFQLPEEHLKEQRFTVAELANLITWQRLLVYRQRENIRRALLNSAGFGSRPKARAPSPDGKILPWVRHGLNGARLKAERRRRLRLLRAGKLEFEFSHIQASGLKKIVRDATEAGARVIVHTPPTTDLYREIMGGFDLKKAWCSIYEAWYEDPEIEWYSEFASPKTHPNEFSDWVHLNLRGARRYTRRMFEAVRERKYPRDNYCNN